MTKSLSCIKIIACGGGNAGVAEDGVQAPPPESKSSSDRRGWSFRKRSARHRLLSNTVAVETSSDGNKESPESATRNVQTPITSTVPEKSSIQLCPGEKAQLSTSLDSNAVATGSTHEADANLRNEDKVEILEEPLVVVIQTAIRGFLAQAARTKLKSLVKLQSTVRGHLVRKHAVGTLRCAQAIVRMQALVRARYAHLALEGAYTEKKLAGSYGKPLGKDHSIRKSNVRSTSIDTLLSNGFARQLLESTPKAKPMNIKCDPLRPSSAWEWLERWMSVSSSQLAEPVKVELNAEQQESKEVEHCAAVESAESKIYLEETTILFKTGESFTTNGAGTIGFQSHHPNTPASKDNLDQPLPENTYVSGVRETLMKRDENSEINLKSVHPKPTMESEQSLKITATEQLEIEGGSSLTCAVMQSEFKELSLVADSAKLISASYQDAAVESNLETVSSAVDSVIRPKELSLADSSVSRNLRAQVSGSECGTELSVTSTLDSPDLSESGAVEYQHEVNVLEDEVWANNSKNGLGVAAQLMPTNPESTSSHPSAIHPEKICEMAGEFANSAAQYVPANPESLPPHPSAVQPGKIGETAGEFANSVAVGDSTHVEEKNWKIASDLQMEDTGHYVYHGSSPEGSPGSHLTVPESHGTPSSQVSLNAKGKKAGKSGSKHKARSLSASKASPKNPSHDSGPKCSTEQLCKDQKIGKRRSSFGLENSENVDQEPRVSFGSSNSLPSYMQPTESARAKAHASNSPRSSPDVQDKAIYVKKRHSLPSANDRHGSPLTQQSTPQGAKGNGAHCPHDRKWQK